MPRHRRHSLRPGKCTTCKAWAAYAARMHRAKHFLHYVWLGSRVVATPPFPWTNLWLGAALQPIDGVTRVLPLRQVIAVLGYDSDLGFRHLLSESSKPGSLPVQGYRIFAPLRLDLTCNAHNPTPNDGFAGEQMTAARESRRTAEECLGMRFSDWSAQGHPPQAYSSTARDPCRPESRPNLIRCNLTDGISEDSDEHLSLPFARPGIYFAIFVCFWGFYALLRVLSWGKQRIVRWARHARAETQRSENIELADVASAQPEQSRTSRFNQLLGVAHASVLSLWDTALSYLA
ncbi:uncharacterized protein B0I36DRAFT_349604 [Microdochium trichocladiopsis]|uniref:Uncharacterized protein n=1 Tax=Microdochium trichocladiopsis TaxID=1682393 RepID=A0A9P8Y8B7_9PEZI|nr:uncharacterized protein B0I36DRAFT_349604 [Microdochium trichocladiopsis]KAH7031538.1 hypothetical protein B0I36DRAFT_349604 [Microdochium trichocladiopsis]